MGGRSIRVGESGLINKERDRNRDGNDEVIYLEERRMGIYQGRDLKKNDGWGFRG